MEGSTGESPEMGYTQELRRGLNMFMSFAYTFTVCAIVPGIALLYNFGLSTGGPVVMVWTWVASSLGCLITGVAMAEICAAYPHTGSVYQWGHRLVPNRRWSRLAGFVCGWLNLVGNLANSTSFAYGFVTIIAAAAYRYNPTGTPLSTGAQVGISILVLALWCLQNLLRIDQQGWIVTSGVVLQVVGSFAVVITALVTTSSLNTATFVFTEFNNGTGLNNVGYVSLIGILSSLYCYGGFDAGANLAEETKNASKVAPLSIIYAIVVSFVAGILLLVGLLFCTPPHPIAGFATGIDILLDNSLNATSSSSPVAQQAIVTLFFYTSGRVGGLALSLVTAMLVYASGMSAVTSASRISYAMARDDALPFSAYLKQVEPHTKSPLGTVLLVFTTNSALLLLPLGSTTAFTQITAITAIGFQLSYAVPILLRRTLGLRTFEAPDAPNAFRISPSVSAVVGWIAVVWCCFSALIMLLPQQFPVRADNMNYACVILGGIGIIAFLHWRFTQSEKYPLELDDIEAEAKAEMQQEPEIDCVTDSPGVTLRQKLSRDVSIDLP